MALIRATCSDCGDVELRSRDLRVRTCQDTDEATYLFRCPVCRMIEVRPPSSTSWTSCSPPECPPRNGDFPQS